MKNKLWLSILVLMTSVCGFAQNIYVVMKDGSSMNFPIQKVDSLSFDSIKNKEIMGFKDLLVRMSLMQQEIDSLKEAINNNKEVNDPISVDTSAHKYVDLGLPSGTLWATCNIGALSPEDYGQRFRWGDTIANDTTKRELNLLMMVDRVKNLTEQYDAATANWGKEWRMPSVVELTELSLLRSVETSINNIPGIIFFSSVNEETLFFPYNEREGGNYWSSSLSTKTTSYVMGIDGRDIARVYSYYGYHNNNFLIRPVVNKK